MRPRHGQIEAEDGDERGAGEERGAVRGRDAVEVGGVGAEGDGVVVDAAVDVARAEGEILEGEIRG